MKRMITSLAGFMAIVGMVGCSMCCAPNDYDYPNYGGKYERVNPAYGRVGSIFSDPNAGALGPSSDSNLDSDPRGSSNAIDGFDVDPMLEGIEPLDDSGQPPTRELLPNPDKNENDPTAKRLINRQPLRAGQSWR